MLIAVCRGEKADDTQTIRLLRHVLGIRSGEKPQIHSVSRQGRISSTCLLRYEQWKRMAGDLLTYLLTYLRTYLFVRSFVCLFIYLIICMYLFIYLFLCLTLFTVVIFINLLI